MCEPNQSGKAMTWQEKLSVAQKIMGVLDATDVGAGRREQELADVLEIVVKLLLPIELVGLCRYRVGGF
jgi:hypothetical protein